MSCDAFALCSLRNFAISTLIRDSTEAQVLNKFQARQSTRLLQWMPQLLEFSIVVIVAFGFFIFSSLYAVLHELPHAPINQTHLQSLLYFEPIVCLALMALLWARGWTLEGLGLKGSWRDAISGALLAFGAYVAYFALLFIVASVSESFRQVAQQTVLINSQLGLGTVIAVSIVNPIFEEIFVCSYIITSLNERKHAVFAINASILIRLSYHLYQGAVGVVSLIPIGIVFGYYFARTRRLWPVIVAHAIFDFAGLVAYVKL